MRMREGNGTENLVLVAPCNSYTNADCEVGGGSSAHPHSRVSRAESGIPLDDGRLSEGFDELDVGQIIGLLHPSRIAHSRRHYIFDLWLWVHHVIMSIAERGMRVYIRS